jgi:hypothetical protein
MDDATGVRAGKSPSYAGGAHADVQVIATIPADTPANAAVTKVIVAVHGVGDQYSYATIQSVVNQFCSFYRQPAGVPLGNFHTGRATFSIPPPYPQKLFERFAFAEVYWAKIPRTAVDDKHTLEEAKKWAHTIVERFRLRWHIKGKRGGHRERDFQLLHRVLAEMIETLAVVDRLCYLAERAGLFTFDLRQLLDAYLGDVQIVTEFEGERGKILQTFADVMDAAHKTSEHAEIYVVAHSEGTVVAFLALLKAFRETELPAWAGQVRGLMTLGSPIDKHLVLWPELFGEAPPAHLPKKKIEWRNYYDHGDPIGFALDNARAWLDLPRVDDRGTRTWDGVFNFTDAKGHDNGFTRYPFPGKAHVDYWADEAVFGHFIETVVKEQPPISTAMPSTDFRNPPRSLWYMQALSYIVPYAGVAALLLVAAYVLVRAVADALNPYGFPYDSNKIIAKNIIGLAILLVGITVAARIPRLTRDKSWRVFAVIVGLLAAGVYDWSGSVGNWGNLFGFPCPPSVITPVSTMAGVYGRSGSVGNLGNLFGFPCPPHVITPVLTMAVVLLVCALGALRPLWGVTPLIGVGTLAVTLIVGDRFLNAEDGDLGPLWPVIVATVAFLYIWWLAALMFDLVFIWHLYIRHSRLLHWMDEIIGGSKDKRKRHTGLKTATHRNVARTTARTGCGRQTNR